MELTPEQIRDNWELFLNNISTYISEPRASKLIKFYKKYEDRIIIYPASHKKEYHNAMMGGYIEHVNRVVECSLKLNKVWKEMGVDDTTYTLEELIFSAINHDLGKIGDENHEAYIQQTDDWRRDKLGEEYTFNTQLPFSSVPDRGLYLLQYHDIKYSFNEMVAIQTHDGLYDEGNKKYLISYSPEQKPRTSLPYILHQADLMAARLEFERDWLPKLNNPKQSGDKEKPKKKVKKDTMSQKALKSISSNTLAKFIDDL